MPPKKGGKAAGKGKGKGGGKGGGKKGGPTIIDGVRRLLGQLFAIVQLGAVSYI